jgi:hypothetical protein
MKMKLHSVVIVVLLAIAGPMVVMVGCNDEHPPGPSYTASNVATPLVEHEKYVDESDRKSVIIESAKQSPDVAEAIVWLEDQGYTLVDTNSVAALQKQYEILAGVTTVGDRRRSAGKATPESIVSRQLKNTDSMAWLAFENPTHDLGNHTAIITRWTDNQAKDIAMLELDISGDSAQVIRGAYYIEGEMVPTDIPIEGFWDCWLSGAAGGAVGCLVTNCAYFKCLAGVTLATGVSCAIQAVF